MSEPASQNYHVDSALDGAALGAALRRWRSGPSWSEVRRWIRGRHVQINGNLCLDEGRRLKTGDVVKWWREPRPPPPRADDVRICYTDRHLLVVEKPAGVTTLRHSEERNWSSRRRQRQPTLDELVRQALAAGERKRGRRVPGRRGKPTAVRAVHRLDRDTSGLIAFARTAQAERRMVEMFRDHRPHRTYLALAVGRVEEQTFRSRLVRDRGDGLRGSTSDPAAGKRAVTHVRPVEVLDGYTLLECRLETGRTHQIRIHLAEAGHMVCGEKVYRRALRGKPQEDRSGAPRQMLHAAELGFEHPVTGQPLAFKARLPADMERVLAQLRGQSGRPEPRRSARAGSMDS